MKDESPKPIGCVRLQEAAKAHVLAQCAYEKAWTKFWVTEVEPLSD